MTESILIIDDNEDILKFLFKVLGAKYEIFVARDAEKGLAILAKDIVNLIVADIMIPYIDGYELCRQLKSNVAYCHIPFILITAKNTYSSHIKGLEVGADACVQKPLSSEFLQHQIANLLKNRKKVKDHFSNSPFEDFRLMAHSKSDEAFLKRLDDYIRRNLRDPDLDIGKLSEHMNMSRPTFYRKIKSLTPLSPKELIDLTRLKKAAKLIGDDEHSLFEIARIVGYSSQSLFTKNFQKYFKATPLEYANSLPKQMMIH